MDLHAARCSFRGEGLRVCVVDTNKVELNAVRCTFLAFKRLWDVQDIGLVQRRGDIIVVCETITDPARNLGQLRPDNGS